MTPELLGPYRVQSVIGRGGMGVVYLGEHRETGDRVALKTLRGVEAPLLAAIRREVHALSRILHPGVVRIVGHGDEEGVPWYAMELIDGVPLRAFVPRPHDDAPDVTATAATTAALSERPTVAYVPGASDDVPFQELPGAGAPELPAAGGQLALVLGFVQQLCPILAYLHGEGFVHRDLKPDNVLVRNDGTLVVVDFGLLQASPTGREVLEPTDLLAGTVAYMAPEQLRGAVVDGRADLYALGCILFELLVGRPPFAGQGPSETVAMHLGTPPPRPSALVRGVPAQLDELVAGLLAKDPRERLGHAGIAAAAIEALGVAPDARARVAPLSRSYLYRARLVGRQAIMTSLGSLLDGAAQGFRRLAILSGESGVGKTRLASELMTAAQGRGFHVAAAEPARPDVPVPPLHALRPLLRVVADACLASGRAAHARLLGPRGRILAPYLPELAALAGHEEHPDPPELPPSKARLRLFTALLETIRRLAGEAPVLAIVDDVQWCDELSLAFLSHLEAPRGAGAMPLLLLATYRTDAPTPAVEELRAMPGVTDLPVGQLDATAVGALVSELLALQTPPAELVGFLARQSEGNPLFVAEYLRSAVDERLISRDARGRWAPSGAGSFDALALPASLQEILTLRLSSLAPPAARLLDVIAVAGVEVDVELLGAAGPVDLGALQELLRRQVLEEVAAGRYRVGHERLREVAYDRVEPGRRAELHGVAARVLEARNAPLAAVARHWELAGDRAQAADRYGRAGQLAIEQGAMDAADQLLSSHLRLTDVPTPVSVTMRNDRAFRVLRRLGRVREALAEHERALAEAAALGSPVLKSNALIGAGAALQRLGELDEAEGRYEEAVRIARSSGEARQIAIALGNLGALQQERGRTERALALTEESLAALRTLGLTRELAIGQMNLALLHAALGRTAEAEVLYREAIAALRAGGDRYHEGFTLANLGVLQAQLGRLAEGRTSLALGLAVARECGDRHLEISVAVNLGLACQEGGDHAAARRHLEEALAATPEVDTPGMEAEVRMELARIAQQEGRRPDADALAEEAISLAASGAHPSNVRDVQGGLAALMMERGDLAEARRIMAQLEGQDALVAGIPRAVIDAFRARLCLLSGDLPRAADLAAKAAATFRPVRSLLRLADCLVVLGHVALSRGDEAGVAEARALLAEGQSLLQESGAGPGSRTARDVAELGRRLA